MRRSKRPFYRRPWLWIIVIVLLIAGGWFISNNQTTETQKDTVVKSTKKVEKKKKSAKKDKAREEKKTQSTNDVTSPASSSSWQATEGTTPYHHEEHPVTPNTGSGTDDSWIDHDNYEPNSIVGDSSTMRYYLPGQSYPEIAPENKVYFDSPAEAQTAGYQAGQ